MWPLNSIIAENGTWAALVLQHCNPPPPPSPSPVTYPFILCSSSYAIYYCGTCVTRSLNIVQSNIMWWNYLVIYHPQCVGMPHSYQGHESLIHTVCLWCMNYTFTHINHKMWVTKCFFLRWCHLCLVSTPEAAPPSLYRLHKMQIFNLIVKPSFYSCMSDI